MVPAEATTTPVEVDSLAAASDHFDHNHSHSRLRTASWRYRTRRTTTTPTQQQTAPPTTAPETAAPETAAVEAPAATTPAVTTPSAAEAVFDLSGLSDTEATWARTVLDTQCNFDWNRLSARMGGGRVRVELGTPPARGMYYPPQMRLEVHRNFYLLDRTVASRVLAWEAAHVADIYGLSESQHQAISALYHGGETDDHGWFAGTYEDQVGEAFMEGFVAAFCPELQTRSYFSHETTPEIAAGIREIVLQ